VSGAWWDRLGDDELVDRLIQRDMAPDLARYLARTRDRSEISRRQIATRLAH
jgi:hypothetical protein